MALPTAHPKWRSRTTRLIVGVSLTALASLGLAAPAVAAPAGSASASAASASAASASVVLASAGLASAVTSADPSENTAASVAKTPSVKGAIAAEAAVSSQPVLNYVALGDSYSSGIGLSSQVGASECGQSTSNYPHLIASTLKLRLTDVTCAGAAADNVWKTPKVLADGTVLPLQTDALSASTDIVTITVGGNGLKFTDIAAVCAAQSATGPLVLPALSSFSTCQSYFAFAGVDLAAVIKFGVATDLRATYAAIRAKAPNAQIFVLGYPTIAPDTYEKSCFTPLGTANSFPFTDSDTPFLHGIEAQLAATVQTEATNAGFGYVTTYEKSASHSVCDTTPYVNGVSLALVNGAPAIAEKSLHPNQAGSDFMGYAATLKVALVVPKLLKAKY